MKSGFVVFMFSLMCSECFASRINSMIEVIDTVIDKYISPQCAKGLELYRNRLNNTGDEDVWALQMLDATSKIPTGLMSYNYGDTGHFDQCINIKSLRDSITGKYCMANIYLNSTVINENAAQIRNEAFLKHLLLNSTNDVHIVEFSKWAICLPSHCTYEDALVVTNYFQIPGTVVSYLLCQTIDDITYPIDAKAIVGITILSLLVLIVLLSTAYDIYCHKTNKENLHLSCIAFSAYTNGQKLFRIQKRASSLSCLDGIRVLSMAWVIIFHIYLFYAQIPLYNSMDLIKVTDNLASMFIVNGHLACDTFLIVGGTLVTYVYFRKKTEAGMTTYEVFKHYFHRYVRLTSPLAGLVLVSATLIKYMGSGPKWSKFAEFSEQSCGDYWWTSLLYVQNQVNPDGMCTGHTWYLDIDMQLYIFSPLIFWLLQKYTKTGYTIITIGIVASMILSFFASWNNDIAAIWSNLYARTPNSTYLHYYYLKTETRASPWLLGIILGYLLTRKHLTDKRFSKKIVIPMWILCISIGLLCVLGGHDTLRGPDNSRLENAIYIATVRTTFALTVAWVIWACATQHGGIINDLLSLSIFQFVSQFTYSMYLLHEPFLYIITFSMRGTIEFSIFDLAYWFWGTFIFMFAAAIIWVLLFESPMMILEKLFIKKLDKIALKNTDKDTIIQK